MIAELNDIPVGTVRADYDGAYWELSWTVAPEERGKGLATVMVCQLAERIDDPIRAEVKKENLASTKVALSAGMKFSEETNGIHHYKRESLSLEV